MDQTKSAHLIGVRPDDGNALLFMRLLAPDLPDGWRHLDSHPSTPWLHVDHDLLTMVYGLGHYIPECLLQLAHDLRHES